MPEPKPRKSVFLICDEFDDLFGGVHRTEQEAVARAKQIYARLETRWACHEYVLVADLADVQKDAHRWQTINKLILGAGSDDWVDKLEADRADAERWREYCRQYDEPRKDDDNGN